MTRILQIAKVVAFASLAFLLIALGVLVVCVGRVVPTFSAVADQTAGTVSNLNATLVAINRPCGGGHPCGTLADVAKTLNTVRGTAGQIEIAARHEDQRIGVLDAQEDALFSDTHNTLVGADNSLRHFSTVMDSADKTITGLQPIEARATTTIASIDQLIPNLNRTTVNVASMSDSGKNILADGAYETHKLTHPKKKTGFWVGFWFVVEKLKPPLF